MYSEEKKGDNKIGQRTNTSFLMPWKLRQTNKTCYILIILINKVYNNANKWNFLMLWPLAIKTKGNLRLGISDLIDNIGLKILK
jgi:hypothetical protein